MHIPFLYAGSPGVSALLATANLIASTGSSQVNGFEVFSAQLFGAIFLDNESVERSRTDEGAFVEIKVLEMNQIVNTMANRLYQYSFLDGTGTIAFISLTSSVTGTSITLSDPGDATRIELGDRLVFATTASGTDKALGSFGQGWIVGGVNRDTGLVSGINSSGSPVAVNDSVYGCPTVAAGDAIAIQSTRNAVIKGFAYYCPAVAPTTGDNAWGLDRSKDVTRLAGTRYDGTSNTPLEAFVRAANRTAKNNGKVNTGVVNYAHFSDIVMELNSRGIVNFLDVTTSSAPGFSFEAVKVYSGAGAINIMPSHAAPSTVGELLDPTKWKLASVGELIRVGGGDDRQFLRVNNQDQVQGYWTSYAQLVPLSPKDMCNIALPQAS